MSTLSTVTSINTQIANNVPYAILFAQAFGQNATGPEKQAIAVRVLTGIEVATGALETHSNPIVAQTAALVNMAVQIAKLFKHSAFVPATQVVA